mgnify:CR=1 FL=1
MKSLIDRIEEMCINGNPKEAAEVLAHYSENREQVWYLILYVIFLIFTLYASYHGFEYRPDENYIKFNLFIFLTPIFLFFTIRHGVLYYKFIKYLRSKNINNFF